MSFWSLVVAGVEFLFAHALVVVLAVIAWRYWSLCQVLRERNAHLVRENVVLRIRQSFGKFIPTDRDVL